MRRATRILLASALLASLVVAIGPTQPAISTPVATDENTYLAYGRIFPDPQGCGQTAAPDQGLSPYEKGDVCATDFLQHSEMVNGLKFMEDSFPRYVEFYTLHRDFNCKGQKVGNPDNGCKAFKSAGLPQTIDPDAAEAHTRARVPLHMVRITDENYPIKGKKHFVFPLSIHGIERAGVEGGTRAAEDLATWAACQNGGAPEFVDCDDPDNEAPHPLLEATPKRSINAGRAMRRSAVFFIYPNPDGWRRGERSSGNAQSFQRYNGNGVDLNRDWPAQGFTFRPYTPWSEPETFSFGKVLQGIGPKDRRGKPKWTGGIDLHGQLVDRAFSFTLIGGSERPYGKNQRVLQTVKGAWRDAEKRLAYSPLIKPNDAPEDDQRLYGVQWGTIWDTIDYTVTGALGDWIDSPMGLNADGIDNEMSLSHLSNCGVGTCWEPDVEQLHVDGNKSLIYSMINYSLKPEKKTFRTKGRVAYLNNPGVIKAKTRRFTRPPRFAKLDPQKDIKDVQIDATTDHIYPFTVKGPKDGVYNGGINIPIHCVPVGGIGQCALTEAQLQRKNPDEPSKEGEKWETVNTYFNQSPIYLQAGQALHANLPEPGRYRILIDGAGPADVFKADINFTREKGWPDPGQLGYRVTSMKFWRQLSKYTRPGIDKLRRSTVEHKRRWRKRYDTIIVTNRVLPKLADDLARWVTKNNGNLILTDKAVKMLVQMGVVKGGVGKTDEYAGYVNFATPNRDTTYKDPLAKKINQPGAAEGQSGDEVRRRQVYEPVPLGISIQAADGDDAYNSPVWHVKHEFWRKSRGHQRSVASTSELANISYGEIKWLGGRVRIIGGLLPDPVEKFDHPFGLANYALTYSGYQMVKNMITYERQVRNKDLPKTG